MFGQLATAEPGTHVTRCFDPLSLLDDNIIAKGGRAHPGAFDRVSPD